MADALKGILPAVASPCDENDTFLEEKFAALAQSLYEQGVHGLYVCGATGDGYHMLTADRKRATEIAVDLAADYDRTVITHVGTSTTRDSVELATHAAQAGVDAISAMPPANCSIEQLVSYYREITSAAQVPLVVYYIPKLTGIALTVDEMLRLVDLEGVAGFKFSDWDLFFMKRVLMARPDVAVFNGNDEFLCPGLLYGASGGIGMNYNLFPKLFLGIYEAVNSGDVARAMELETHFLAYADVIFSYGLRASFETLMRDQDLAPYCFRQPRQRFDEATSRKFLQEVRPKVAAIEQAVVAGQG